jgi:large subunit ribosomal protein L6
VVSLAKLLATSIHRAEVKVPKGVEVEVEGKVVRVKGAMGNLTRDFSRHLVEIAREGESIVITSRLKGKRGLALVNTIASHIENMITGVNKGFTYRLKVVYAHFPISVKVEGDRVIVENFRGEKKRRVAKVLKGVKLRVEGEDIVVSGIDLEAVSQTAANIELATKARGYDPRVFMDGIYVYKKEVGLLE